MFQHSDTRLSFQMRAVIHADHPTCDVVLVNTQLLTGESQWFALLLLLSIVVVLQEMTLTLVSGM